jgi:predicted small lipoprotein YifL
MRLATTLALASALAGCAAFGPLDARDAERERAEARTDHAACTRDAHAFPSEGYTTCRRRLAEERQRRHWMELSLAQQQSASRTPDHLPAPPPGVYTPVDASRYRCAAEGAGADEVILCRER